MVPLRINVNSFVVSFSGQGMGHFIQRFCLFNLEQQNDYQQWGVTTTSFYANGHVFQDWFTVLSVGSDGQGTFLTLDHELRFDVYANSIAGEYDLKQKLRYSVLTSF